MLLSGSVEDIDLPFVEERGLECRTLKIVPLRKAMHKGAHVSGRLLNTAFE